MYRPVSNGPVATLIPEAQWRLDEAVRHHLLPEGELEPSVLQQLAGHPEEVQKSVIDRFLATGLSYDVQNKTGWLVGILKRELRAFQEAVRFRRLFSGVAKKLESALKTKRLRPEEFPSEVIDILSKCSAQEQQAVVDKFLQRHGTSSIQTPIVGAPTNQRGPPVPFSTAREELYEIIGAQLGPHLLDYSNISAENTQPANAPQKKYGLLEHYRITLQQQLKLHNDVLEMLIKVGDGELYEKLMSVGNLPPNYLDADAVWSSLAETAVDEQMRIMKELVVVHAEGSAEGDSSRHQMEKRRENFRVEVERIMTCYGFHGFGGRSQIPAMRSKIIDDGFTTRFDLSNLRISNDEWKKELSSTSKRKLKQFMRGKSPALTVDFHGSLVGEIGDHLQEFFSNHKPIMEVSLVSLNLVDTDMKSDDAWTSLANFLLTSPTRELELTASSISSLALGVLVQTMADGEFPQYAPFYQVPDVEPPTLAIFLPNSTTIRFPSSNEDWMLQWLAAGHMMMDSDTVRQVQHIYSQLRSARPSELWGDAAQWNHSSDQYKSSGIQYNDMYYSSHYSSSTTDSLYPDMYAAEDNYTKKEEFTTYQAGYPAFDRMGYAPYYGGEDPYNKWCSQIEAAQRNSKLLRSQRAGIPQQLERVSTPEISARDDYYNARYPMKAPPPAPPMYLPTNSVTSNGYSTTPTDSGTEDQYKWIHPDMLRREKFGGISAFSLHERAKESTVASTHDRDEDGASPMRRVSYPIKAPPPAPLGSTPIERIAAFPVIVDVRVSVSKESPVAKKAKNKIPKNFKIDSHVRTAVI